MTLAVLFMLNLDIYTEFSIRQGFKDTEELNCAKCYFTCS